MTSKTKPIRFAVVGAGMIGGLHAKRKKALKFIQGLFIGEIEVKALQDYLKGRAT